MESFAKITSQSARKIVSDGKPEYFAENHSFYEGDHWQKGEGFADPVPPPGNVLTDTVVRGIKRIFVAENHIRETTKRRTDGILARAPKWEIVQRRPASDTEQTHEDLMVPEATLPLRSWWETRGVHNIMKEAVTESSLVDNAVLRVYIPPGRLVEGRVKAATLEQALDYIFIDMLKSDQATVYTDKWSMQDIGVAIFKGRTFSDPVPEDNAQTTLGDYAEMTYLSSDQTIHRIVFDDGRPNRETAYDLGGRMMMFRVKDTLLVTEQIRQLQRTINTTLTHMALNNRETNFQQRIFMNAQAPGTVEVDKETGKTIVTIEQFERGPDKDLFVMGAEVERLDGTLDLKDPSLEVINPTDPRGYIESIGEYRRGLYREAKQLHIELIKDATSTGEARLQAVADFEQDINDLKSVVDRMGQWILETVYAVALQLIGQTIDDDIRAAFDAQITIGPIPSERRRVLIEEKNAGLRSTFSAMSEGGIESPEEEIRRLADDILFKVKLAESRAAAIGQFTAAGVELESAARLVGMTEDEIQILVKVNESTIRGGGDPFAVSTNGAGTQPEPQGARSPA